MNNRFVNDVVNVGNDLETPILDLASLVKEVANSSSKIVHLPPLAEGDMDRRKPDIAKMRELINRPLTPLKDGLQRILAARAH